MPIYQKVIKLRGRCHVMSCHVMEVKMAMYPETDVCNMTKSLL